MIITEITDLFKSRIAECDSDLCYDGQIFDTELTSLNALDRTYKLVVGASSVSRLNSSYQAEISVGMSIYRVLSSNKEEDFASVYEQAFDLAAGLQDQTTLSQSDFVKSILATSIEPEIIEDDDNTVRVSLGFVVQVYYRI